jgi:lysophospholipase L1-like esterase
MGLPRALAVPAGLVVLLTVVGAWIDGSRSSSAGPAATSTAPSNVPPRSTTTAPGPPRTSCTSVVHIGDSTSVGLIGSDYLHDPAERIDAQYARVGVNDFRSEISGARSIVEHLKKQENATEVAGRQRAGGFHGCWVVALGTTDAANMAAGAPLTADQRIDQLMGVIGSDPVLWVNVKTLVDAGAWSEPHMAAWDEALTAAAARYPNVKVYDWAAVARNEWFQPDRIHYTSAGYARRAHLIADALAAAYPA